jgi:hypothetical protein
LHPNKLFDTETEWGPIRLAAVKRLVDAGLPPEKIPRHWHWNWDAKSSKLSLLAYRCFGIECEGKMQGLMMMDTASKFARLPPDKGKPLVYVDYLESAPWNVKPLADEPLFSGTGVVLMRAAIQLSIDEGFHGRVGLHSLAQAEEFYRDKCGMQFCANDPRYQDLPYYELTRELSAHFIGAP